MKVRLQQLYNYVWFWRKFPFNNLSNLLLFSLCHTENLLLDQQSLVLVFANSSSFFHNIGTIFFPCQDIPNFSRIKVPKLSHEIWAVLPPAHSPLSHIIYCHLVHLGGPWSTTALESSSSWCLWLILPWTKLKELALNMDQSGREPNTSSSSFWHLRCSSTSTSTSSHNSRPLHPVQSRRLLRST